MFLEVTELTEIAKERGDLAKALIRASAKSAKPAVKRSDKADKSDKSDKSDKATAAKGSST